MSTSSPETLELLRALVSTPSVSGDEAAAAERLAAWARARGLTTVLDDAGVRIVVSGRDPGPTFALASHLDTVPPGEGWEIDPFAAEVRDGCLWGRGASDAKASVVAMAGAAADLAAVGGPARGRLAVLATFGEETAATTMAEAVERLGSLDAAIVGEPTSLRPCTAQRGVLILRLRWKGTAAHAGWAADLPGGADNAIATAAGDLAALADLRLERAHPVLGRIALTPTRIEGGTANNVVPAACTALIDVRTTPAYEVEEILEAVSATVSAEIEVVSRRFLPCQTPEGSRLLAAVRRVRPGAEPFGSPTASDWVFLRHADAVKLGPGDSRLSHTVREHVAIEEVVAARDLYRRIAEEYLA